MPAISYQAITHHRQHCILVKFEKNEAWNKRISRVEGAKWSKTFCAWTIPDTFENRVKCKLPVLRPSAINGQQLTNTGGQTTGNRHATAKKPLRQYINENNSRELKRYLQQLHLKAYSFSTIKTYRNEFTQLLQALKELPVQNLKPEDLQRYLLWCIHKGLTEHTMHSRINALKFYFEQVLHREKFFFEIPRPKKPLQLPKVLNKEEIAEIIKAIQNLKHKTMIMLAYGCGLRVSEITALTVNDVDGKRRLLMIKKGKGKKDRVISLSPALLIMLREYYKKYRPGNFLFEGNAPGAPYSIRSLEAIIKLAKEKAGITKSGSMHMLRHSFATHLLDKGTDVVLIQKLLGHNDINTTLRYLHVSNKDLLNILSPIEDIKQLL